MCVNVINHVKRVAGCCWCYSLRLLHMIRKRIMWRISICLLHVALPNPWGEWVCSCVCPWTKPVGIPEAWVVILFVPVSMHTTTFFPVTIPVCTNAHVSPQCIWVCKFNVSVFGEGLNYAQRDSKIEWMSAQLPLIFSVIYYPQLSQSQPAVIHIHALPQWEYWIQWWWFAGSQSQMYLLSVDPQY